MFLAIAFVMGVIDSALGMMYGTLTTPILILLGVSAKIAVPSVLVSQASCDLAATFRHQKLKNGNFTSFSTKDTKLVMSIVIPGILACIAGVFFAVKIPANYLNLYIGVLVTVMGLLCIFPVNYSFAWWKIWLVGILSSFNKAISGGGFGPVTVTGKILGGVDPKISVATTILSKAIICGLSFGLWVVANGTFDYKLPLALIIGAVLGSQVGPYITGRSGRLREITGVFSIITGLLVIILKFKA